jgi:hypothetical protein
MPNAVVRWPQATPPGGISLSRGIPQARERRAGKRCVVAKHSALVARGAVPNCRGNTSHGTKLPAAPHDLWRFLKAPAPLRAQGSYGPGDALAGAIQSFSPRSATRAALFISREHMPKKQRHGGLTTRRVHLIKAMSLLSAVELHKARPTRLQKFL